MIAHWKLLLLDISQPFCIVLGAFSNLFSGFKSGGALKRLKNGHSSGGGRGGSPKDFSLC